MPNTPRISVRPFVASDFDKVVAIMPPEWCFAGCSEDEQRAQARMDFAGVLAGSNLRLVAERDNSLCGIVFSHVGGLPDHNDAPFWTETWERAREELSCGSTPARLACRYEEQLGERGELLLRQADAALVPPHELELFVVAPTERGRGIGAALMAAFEEALRTTPTPSYWLQTDTTCTWQWYASHGYERVADVELDASYPMPESGPTPPHVFLYRRDVPSL